MGLPGVPQSDRADVGNEHQDSDQQRHEDLPAVGTERAKALEQGWRQVRSPSSSSAMPGPSTSPSLTFMWAGLVPCLRRGEGLVYGPFRARTVFRMKLVIEDDEGHRSEVPLDREEITIGRREDNTVHLPERNVSRLHARLLRRSGVLVLEDLSSANGTRLNGVRIQSAVSLRSGDVVGIGNYGSPCDRTTRRSTSRSSRTRWRRPRRSSARDVMADTAPHPLVPVLIEAPAPEAPVPTPEPVKGSRKLTWSMVAVGLVLGLAVALLLRAWNISERPRQVVPPPEPPPLASQEVPPPTPSEPPPIELPADALPAEPRPAAQHPHRVAGHRAGRLPGRGTSNARCDCSGRCAIRPYQAEVQSLRRTWKAEAAAGRTVRLPGPSWSRGRPRWRCCKLEAARSSRAWAPRSRSSARTSPRR